MLLVGDFLLAFLEKVSSLLRFKIVSHLNSIVQVEKLLPQGDSAELCRTFGVAGTLLETGKLILPAHFSIK